MKDKERIAGNQLTLNKGDIEMIEDILSADYTITKMFRKLLDESARMQRKENELWRKYEMLAKVQFTEFNTDEYILSYNWVKHTISIHDKADKDKGLIGDK